MKLTRMFKRTLVIMVILFGVIANVTSIFSGWMLYTHLSQEYESKAVAIAKSIANFSVEIFLNRDAATIQAIIDQYVEIPGLSYVLVAYRDGEVIAHTFVPRLPDKIRRIISGEEATSPGAARPGGDEVTVREVGEYIDVSAPILAGQAGFVHVGMDRLAIRQSIQGVFLQIQLITLVIFLVSVTAAYLFINRLSQPLLKLTDYARRLAAHDFSAAMDIRSKDEVGQLAEDMAAMGRELSDQFSRMQRAVQAATAELQEALAYQSAVIDNLAEGLMVLDPQGRLKQANPAAAHMLGRSQEQSVGLDCRALLGLGVEELLALAGQAAPAGAPRVREITALRTDGGQFPLELAVSLLQGQEGTGLVVIMRDATERRRAEQVLHQAQEELEIRVAERTAELERANLLLKQEVSERIHAEQALRQSQERFRSLSDNAPDIIYTLGPDGSFTYVNPAWTRILGHQPREVLGRRFVDFVQPEEAAACAEHIQRIVASGETLADVTRTLIHRDGSPRVFNKSASPNLDAEGRLTGVVGTLKDVTEHRRLEAQLLHAQKMEAVGTLAGGVAHEFNNILMTIKGYTQLMGMAQTAEPAWAEYLERVDESCRRAAALTTKMLTFSRLDVGEKAPVQVGDVLEGVRQMLGQTLPPQIELKVKVEAGLAPVLANPAQLEQVLLNLALNARDAMGQAGRLSLSAGQGQSPPGAGLALHGGPFVEITVADDGPGMPPEVLARVFEPFFTTKEPGKGTGLGLSVAYSIVKSHGGQITADSAPGQGTRFRVWLPALGPGAQAAPAAAAPPPRAAPGEGERVLVVDDEPDLRDIVCQALEAGGYRVATAANGQEALDLYGGALAEGRAYHLVILDLAMPVMDGEECLRRLLQMHPQARVVMATGHGGDQTESEFLGRRARAVLLKPFDLQHLLLTARRALDD